MALRPFLSFGPSIINEICTNSQTNSLHNMNSQYNNLCGEQTG